MASENQPLIINEDSIQQPDSIKTDRKTVTIRHHILWPYLIFFFTASDIFGFVHNEWIHDSIKLQYFKNVSIHNNYSACEVTNKSDPDYVTYKKVQQMTAQWQMFFKFASYIPAFFVNLFLPSYTDVKGRKFLIVLTSFAYCVRMCGECVIIYTNQKLFYILFFYVFEGLFGSRGSLYAVLFSYIADITPDGKKRVLGFIAIEYLLMVITTISALLSGLLIENLNLGFKYTAIICCAVAVFTFFLVALFLPETLEKSQKKSSISIAAAMKQTFAFYFSSEFKGKRKSYILLIVAFIFLRLSHSNHGSMEILYFLGQPFCWGPSLIGYFKMAVHGSQGLIGLTSVKFLQKCLSNNTICAISLVSAIVSYAVEGLARSDLVIYCVPVLGVFAFIMVPMFGSMMSLQTSSDRQGSMFASLETVQGVCVILTSSENEIYAATLSIMNGFVFLCMSFFVLLAFLLFIIYSRIQQPIPNDIKHAKTET